MSIMVPAATLRTLREALRERGPAAAEGSRLEGQMQRVTGRRYQLKLEQLSADGRRELARFLRDAEERIHVAERKVREPWRR